MSSMRVVVVAAVTLALAMLFAGTATADVVVKTCYNQNPDYPAPGYWMAIGNPKPPCQEAANVTAQVSVGDSSMTVTNPSSNPSNYLITSFEGYTHDDGDLGGPLLDLTSTDPARHAGWCRQGFPFVNGESEGADPFYPHQFYAFDCEMAFRQLYDGALRPGESATVNYDCIADGCPWDEINVIFNYSTTYPPGCAPPPPASARAAAVAVMAEEASCTTPARTRIVRAQIDQKRRTARFTFSAKHAKEFACLVQHDERSVYHSERCGRSKFFPKLGQGQYRLFVWGENKAGIDRYAASRSFVIH